MTEKENKQRGETFPVDTLGIPILLDVIEPGDPEAAWSKAAPPPATDLPPDEGLKPATRAETALAAEPLPSTEAEHPAEPASWDQALDELATRISTNLLQSLEPLIQKKINRTLKKHSAEIARLLSRPPSEGDSDPSG